MRPRAHQTLLCAPNGAREILSNDGGKTGTNTWTLASGPMAEAVSHSTSRLMDEDIAAIAS